MKRFNLEKEHKIEIQHERAVDRLDQKYMEGLLSDEEYQMAMESLDAKTEALLEECWEEE